MEGASNPWYKKHHNGIDIAIPQGSSVKSQANGVVEYADEKGAYGNLIIINHGTVSGKEVKTRYAHLSKINVKKGDKIKAGTEIAKSGGKKGTPGAGTSTGAHLHLEVLENGKFANPENYFKF
ncbi:MAG: M23 family metallopeptidase [Candidatus Gastranaerophilales bacterium]|nr:M23 family metallopeptidase [Candidatus Gastranaerophilales bacterium]